ncbi:uncharacterized protein LOC117803799 [Ailuropoda melanoleuca]|uniref:uncharacterized protein LOC117803799 n=1 Tax=Ailuropoda melanoleuca TaxID=9646 RepID=UPI001494D930|nr:uncharacterized protein LOC117803799 [Ailuropoda melanoleuca]
MRTELEAGVCGFSKQHPNMDGQHSEKPHSLTVADRTPSVMSQNPRSAQHQAGTCGNSEGDARCPASHRIFSHVSRPTKDLSCMKLPQDPAHRDRQAHPTTILLCKSQSSQAALVPKEHKMFMKEAYNAAICFKMLRDLNSSDPFRLKYIIKKIKNMAYGTPNLVLETIHDYFVDNPKAERGGRKVDQHVIFSHVSRPTKDLSCMKLPQDPAHRDRQAHPTTILLCKSQSSQAALVPKEHKMFMKEAYNAAICFKMLRDLNSSDPFRLKYIIKKIKNMAYGTPNLVLETIHDYFVDNPKAERGGRKVDQHV